MDTTNLKENYPYLIDFLVKNGYSKDVIHKTQKCIRLTLDVGSSSKSPHMRICFITRLNGKVTILTSKGTKRLGAILGTSNVSIKQGNIPVE